MSCVAGCINYSHYKTQEKQLVEGILSALTVPSSFNSKVYDSRRHNGTG